MSETSALSTREKILHIAGELFFRYGYRAVGVDTIVRETGVAKMTLYRHFPSKDDLIVAYLERVSEQMHAWLDGAIQPYAGDPRRQMQAIFESLEELVQSPQCYGCAFLITAVEYPEPDSPGHRVARAHKDSMRERFRALAGEAGARQPEILADHLLLLMDGAFAAARMFGIRNPGQNVAEAAALLVEAAVA
ncbi:MAG TPA: TetR/AcrR family transcriptional regulator [Anaerolineaceae bacterium]|nr:TetR/AcrR family transcriptional regulator [Anaerolineaceae bacterium]